MSANASQKGNTKKGADKADKKSKGHIVPKTGKWQRVGQTMKQWLKENNHTIKKKSGNNNGTGKQSYEVFDSRGNNIGRIDTGYKIDGKQTPEHFHLYNNPEGNVHYWFE